MIQTVRNEQKKILDRKNSKDSKKNVKFSNDMNVVD